MTIVQTEYLPFNECSLDTQQLILDKCRYFLVEDDHWHTVETDTFEEILSILGFSNHNIYFSGFYSQGDGACFVGDYRYNAGALKKIKKDYPNFYDLHGIVEIIQQEQKINFYKLACSITHNFRYYHHKSVDFEFYKDDEYIEDNETLKSAFQDLMQLIYKSLEDEYNYQISDEALTVFLNDSDYEFSEDGDML